MSKCIKVFILLIAPLQIFFAQESKCKTNSKNSIKEATYDVSHNNKKDNTIIHDKDEEFINLLSATNKQKHEIFVNNKGTVIMVKESGSWLIRSQKKLCKEIAVSTQESKINVNVSDALSTACIGINLNNLNSIYLHLGAGVMQVYEECYKSSFIVESGTINFHSCVKKVHNRSYDSSFIVNAGTIHAKFNKYNIGIVIGKVGIGPLQNNSDLNQLKKTKNSFIPNSNVSLELSGELQNCKYLFKVNTGTICFE